MDSDDAEQIVNALESIRSDIMIYESSSKISEMVELLQSIKEGIEESNRLLAEIAERPE